MRTRELAFVMALVPAAALLAAMPSAGAAAQPGSRQPTLQVVGYGAVQYPHNNGSASAVGAPKSSHCVTLVSDDDGSYPGPFLVEPGVEELRIALHTATKPVTASLAVYAVKPTTDPSQKPAQLAWKATGCGGTDDFGYTFHVEAAS